MRIKPIWIHFNANYILIYFVNNQICSGSWENNILFPIKRNYLSQRDFHLESLKWSDIYFPVFTFLTFNWQNKVHDIHSKPRNVEQEHSGLGEGDMTGRVWPIKKRGFQYATVSNKFKKNNKKIIVSLSRYLLSL